MMKTNERLIHFTIDGNNQSDFFKKGIIGYDDGTQTDIFIFEVTIDDIKYTFHNNTMEIVIVLLQKQLPHNVKITCCQTCRHGNFCPFGDQEDEIFCLIDYSPKNKSDVVEIFIRYSEGDVALPSNRLLYKCENYQEVIDSYYSYNEWLWHFKDNGEI